MRDILEAIALGLSLCALLLACLLAIWREPRAEPVEVSPSYWHYLDSVAPREDTAHYITKEGVLIIYAQETPHPD